MEEFGFQHQQTDDELQRAIQESLDQAQQNHSSLMSEDEELARVLEMSKNMK
jgi:hypothetical protein